MPLPPPNLHRRFEEDALHKACVRWFDLQYPHLSLLLHHSPNEGRRSGGAVAGAKLKKMGTRAGFPDLLLLFPNPRHSFLCIELKTARGRLSASQKAYQTAIQSHTDGLYRVVRSFTDFRTTVNAYLAGKI